MKDRPENVPIYPFEIPGRLSELNLLNYSARVIEEASTDDLDPMKSVVKIMKPSYTGKICEAENELSDALEKWIRSEPDISKSGLQSFRKETSHIGL